MNERDYKIAEAMVISAGTLVTVTILALFYIYNLPYDINAIIVVNFIFFSTFFFGLFFHIRRKLWIKEFEEIIEETKNG